MIILDLLTHQVDRQLSQHPLHKFTTEAATIRYNLCIQATYQATLKMWQKYAEALGSPVSVTTRETKGNVLLTGRNELGQELEPAVDYEHHLIIEVEDSFVISLLEWYPGYKRETMKNWNDSLSMTTKQNACWVPVVIHTNFALSSFDVELQWAKYLNYPKIQDPIIKEEIPGFSVNSELVLPVLRQQLQTKLSNR